MEQLMMPHFARESETSREAALSIYHYAPTVRERVLNLIESCKGLTCDEVEVDLGLSHQTASARIYELRKMDLLVDSGKTRPTRSGRKATVWEVA